MHHIVEPKAIYGTLQLRKISNLKLTFDFLKE